MKTRTIADIIFDLDGESDGWQTRYGYDEVEKAMGEWAKQVAVLYAHRTLQKLYPWVSDNIPEEAYIAFDKFIKEITYHD